MTKYWKYREEENRKKNIEQEKEYANKLKKVYERAFFDVKKEIEAFYGKYANKHGLTMAEVKKQVNTLDIKEYELKAKKYVKNKDFSKQANEEMALYNLTMKVNRLEMLKSSLGLSMVENFNDLEILYDLALNERGIAEFKRQSGILGDSLINIDERVKEIVSASFHNATFSERIWQHKNVLHSELNTILSNALIQGKNPKEFIGEILKKFEVSKSQAERLLFTEMARVQIGVQEESYLKNGYKKYIFLAESTACPICKALDEKTFLISKMLSGENAPPMHPYCRCSTAAYMDDREKVELEDSHKGINRKNIVSKKIYSSEYKRKFDKLGENKKITKLIYNAALEILKHRSGTEYEDLAFIDTKNEKVKISNNYEKIRSAKMTHSMKKMLNENIVAIHNHPNSTLPSYNDLHAYYERKYKYGLIVCHNGDVFYYELQPNTKRNDIFNYGVQVDKFYDEKYKNIDEFIKKVYNIVTIRKL